MDAGTETSFSFPPVLNKPTIVSPFGSFLANTGNQQVFAKMEPNGDAIVGLFNTGSTAEKVSVQASAVGLPGNERGYSTHNLWTDAMGKTGNTISAVVPSHGVVLYRVRAL